MLKKWINPKYLNEKEISGIRNKFFKSKPYPNFNLPDFFNKNNLKKLRNEVTKEKYEIVDKDLFTLSHTKD